MRFSITLIALVASILSASTAAPLEQRGLIQKVTDPLTKGLQGMENMGKGGGKATKAAPSKGAKGKRHEEQQHGHGEMVGGVLLSAQPSNTLIAGQ